MEKKDLSEVRPFLNYSLSFAFASCLSSSSSSSSQENDRLEKENFNLKLRVFFWEEKLSQNYSPEVQEVLKENVDLRTEIEKKTQDHESKDMLLVKVKQRRTLSQDPNTHSRLFLSVALCCVVFC
jgi:hypothetical protein